MDPTLMQTDLHNSNSDQRTPTVLSPSPVITPTKFKSRDLLTDLAGWSSYPDISQAPGSENSGSLHQSGHLMSEMPSGMTHTLGGFRKASHLPTPQSPGNIESYLLTRTPTSQNDTHSTVLPTEFRSHGSPSPPSQPRSIPTPEPSPLTARIRHSGLHSSSQLSRTDSRNDNDRATLSNTEGIRFRASTPPRTPTQHIQTRPVTPVSRSRPTSPIHKGPPEYLFPDSPHPNDSSLNLLSQSIKDHSEVEPTRIQVGPSENHHLSTAETAEFRRPDYLKRTRRLAPSSSTDTGGASFTFGLGSKDGSLLWSSTNVGVVDSPIRGKRIALFQETSEESFEESLMAGGYGRYRSDRSSWKQDEDAEMPKQLGDAKGEGGVGSESVLTEEEKRKKARLAAFLDPPRVPSSAAHLFPVEIEGCGRVLMKVEPSEPQTPPKPRPKAKRSRKRKRASADVKRDLDKEDGIAAAEEHEFDGPNWPDAEFPWRSRSMTRGGLSSAEQEERLRFIESFLDRDSDEDEAEEGHSTSSWCSPDEASSRSPQLGGGKKLQLSSHSQGRRRTTTMLSSVVPRDPADARSALLSKKSIRAVQLRLLRRQDNGPEGDSDEEVLCICQGQDDGRPLVQCDACRTWYHLECIGIHSTSELGREEDPWFCADCAEVKTPPPVTVPLSEPIFAPTDEEGADMGGYEPPFLNAGLNPSPATPWTRSMKPPTTPPRSQRATYATPGSSWDEAPSSSSRGGPRTPQFNTASAFGDMVRVYGMTPGRSLEASSAATDESAFDPTSTPSRGIMFGVPFATPMGSWQGVRGSGNELFHTPKRAGEDGSTAWRQPPVYHGRVGEVSVEEPSGTQSLFRSSGLNNVTPIEREGISGPKRMQVMESPLGAKRSRRVVGS